MAQHERDRYLPIEVDNGHNPSDEDIAYADDFVVTARAVEACARAEDVTLLLSTCRNHWMTVNAAFTDLKSAVGASDYPDALSRGLFDLRRGEWRKAEEALAEAAMALTQVDVKLAVWANRHELMIELRSSIEQMPEPRDRQRMNRLLEAQSHVATTDHYDADGRYISLTTDEHDEAERLLREIRTARTKLGAVVAAARSVREALEPRSAPTLLDEVSDNADEDSWRRLLERLAGKGWAGGGGRSVAEVIGVELPNGSWPGTSVVTQFTGEVLSRCEKVLGGVQEKLSHHFRPNISRTPMPAPYIIDFTRMRRPATGRIRRFTPDLHRGQTAPAPERGRLALLRCGIPKASYSNDTIARYQRDERNDVARVKEIAEIALETSIEKGADFLALPECFLPEDALDRMLERAEEARIGLIAGLEYGPDHAVNNAVVTFPGVAGKVRQQKQTPSKYELPVKGDGVVQKFVDTRLGVFAVAVCSDLMELDYIWSLASTEPRIDTLIVCARNDHPDLFAHLAAADALRMHAHVAIVNAYAPEGEAASGRGTTVFAPRRGTTELEPSGSIDLKTEPWGEIIQPELAWWDLPVAALAMRDTHNTLHGYAAAPRFTKLPADIERTTGDAGQ